MLFEPSILALELVSLTSSSMILLATVFSFQVIRHWDITSGSERQLILERRTYLISTLLTFACAVQIASLVFFIMTCESITTRFVGAMCATGVLNVNPYGWPALFLKILVFFTSAAWLFLNHLDNKAHDYPLIRVKSLLLLFMAPLFFLETGYVFSYFLNLKPDVITSCCGSLFSAAATGVAAEISGISPKTAMVALGLSGAAVIITGLRYEFCSRGGWFYGGLTIIVFVTGIAAIVSFISLYVYELPHHHCPFCILKSGYNFIGYFLFVPLFVGTAAGIGVVISLSCSRMKSLQGFVPSMASRFIRISMVMFLLFYAVSGFIVLSSNLTMVI